MTSDSPLTTPGPWDLVAPGYTTEVKPTFLAWARDAIEATQPRLEDSVLDVATGPGTVALTIASRVREVVALDFSRSMIEQLQKQIIQDNVTNIQTAVGDGQKLSYPENSFDIGISLFGLMFFPDRQAGFDELYRVLKPGGRVAITSWAPIERSPAILLMMAALKASVPADPFQNRVVEGLDNLQVFHREITQAGFENVEIKPVVHGFPVKDPRTYWHSMVEGSAPIAWMRQQADPETWQQQEAKGIAFLQREITDYPTELTSEAYLATARKPE